MPDNDEVGFGDGLAQDELLGMDSEPSSSGDSELSEQISSTAELEDETTESTRTEDDEKAPETPSEPEAEAKPSEEKEESKPEEPETTPVVDSAGSGDMSGEVEVFGRKYPTAKAAFHALKSQVGQIRSWQERYAELEGKFNELSEKFESRSKDAPSATPTPKDETAADAAKAVPKRFTDSLSKTDRDFVEKLANDPEYGPGAAIQFALDRMDDYVQKRIESRLEEVKSADEERYQPVEQMLQSNEQATKAYSAFESLASRTDPDGSPTFPELQENEDNVEFIKRAAVRFKETPGLMDMGEYGAYLAVLDERNWERHLGKTLPDAPSSGIDKRLEDDNSQAAESVTPDGGTSTPLPNGRKLSFEQQFKRELMRDEDETPDSAVLGM